MIRKWSFHFDKHVSATVQTNNHSGSISTMPQAQAFLKLSFINICYHYNYEEREW